MFATENEGYRIYFYENYIPYLNGMLKENLEKSIKKFNKKYKGLYLIYPSIFVDYCKKYYGLIETSNEYKLEDSIDIFSILTDEELQIISGISREDAKHISEMFDE